ncbi:MAG TPA: tetratricopeptide repeat protein [Sediminispirochaeta sp.]|nr:tetratricopeptide repeat protein [Sediminispirochaeta sp.]
MSSINQQGEKRSFKQNLSIFLSNNRTALIVIVALIVLSLAGTAVYTVVHQDRLEKSSLLAEELQGLLEDWRDSEEDAEKSELSQEIEKKAKEAIDSYPKMFAAQRAYLVLGQLAFEKEAWDEALENYGKLADNFGQSYLAPIALMNAAVSSERMNDHQRAISLYQRVVDNYSDTFPDASYALLSIGRLYEKMDNSGAAIDAYNEIIDTFSESNWTNIAHNRIIYLETVN